MVKNPYHKLFNHQALDDPFNHAISRLMFDDIPDTIYVSKTLEIKVNLSLVNDFKTPQDLKAFLEERSKQLPPWTEEYCHDLRRFQRKMLSICEYIYNVGSLGYTRYMSQQYYLLTGRKIEDFVRKDNDQQASE